MRFILILSISLLLFSGCKKETDKSKRYEVLKLLDNGDFNKALKELGDCNKNQSFTEDECHLNRGMAYFGLAGYDITSIGEELYSIYINHQLSKKEQSKKITSILFNRFKGVNIGLGIREYKKALYLNDKSEANCNSFQFKNLEVYSQQACIALNPVLLLEVIDGTTSDNHSVDLEELLDIDKSVRGIIPDISNDEMASVLNGDIDNLSDNSKNELDATQCVIDNTQCYSLNMRQPIQIGTYEDLKIFKVSKFDNSFTTLKLVDRYGSVVLIEEGVYIYDNNESCSKKDYLKFNEKHLCFPKPTKDTLTSKVVEKLNSDDSFRNSLGTMLAVGDKEKSGDEKVDDLMNDICGSPNCTATDKELIEYFKGKKQ